MKYTITVLLLYVVASAKALTPDTLAAIDFGCFRVNNDNYYLVENCVPGTGVEFYSQPWGGKLIKMSTVDSLGTLLFKGDSSFHPAFVLNRNKANENGKKGNGLVGFIQQIEFNLQEMSMVAEGRSAQIYWQGQTYNDAPVNYEVVKVKNGTSTVVATYKGNTAGQYYMYTGDYDAETTYGIKVVNTLAGFRYQAPLNTGATESGHIKIYPTAATASINIVVPAGNTTNSYRIADMQGKIVANGALQAGKNSVQIGNLTPGNYLVFTPNSTPVKIVKE